MSLELANKKEVDRQLKGLGLSCLGAFCFAFGLNVFILPLNLYNGGFMGIAQLLRTLIVTVCHWDRWILLELFSGLLTYRFAFLRGRRLESRF